MYIVPRECNCHAYGICKYASYVFVISMLKLLRRSREVRWVPVYGRTAVPRCVYLASIFAVPVVSSCKGSQSIINFSSFRLRWSGGSPFFACVHRIRRFVVVGDRTHTLERDVRIKMYCKFVYLWNVHKFYGEDARLCIDVYMSLLSMQFLYYNIIYIQEIVTDFTSPES